MVRIAVVGDVHGSWNLAIDRLALKHLQPDLVLFTGDFGNENVELVKEISKLDMPKAVILGNHDCWWSGLATYRPKLRLRIKPNPTAVEDQIAQLGASFLGYKRLDFDHLKVSVVGARPFSIGGNKIFGEQHIAALYGIQDMEASAAKIAELALTAPQDHSLVVLGHNGPTGLGSKPNDICGKDFEKPPGGDHGDADLEEALKLCRGKCNIPLVCFGHMHKELSQDQGERKMIAVGSNGTVYVNAAVVPRERRKGKEREFAMIELENGKVAKVTETWLRCADDLNSFNVVHETVLFPEESEESY